MPANLELALTKIGDVLLKDEITYDKDGNTITDINLMIPNYQRPYKWTPKNVIQLLDDVLEAKTANKEVYRVGTLILHQDKESDYYIVDGQQRIITFTLLLRALNNDLQIKFLDQHLTDNTYNKQNIPTNFNALERRLKNISDVGSRNSILEFVKNNCELIVVITGDISEAFQFFDSQNARGKKLYPHDLLKAYHLREMYDIDINETEKIVRNWEDLDQSALSSLFSDYLYRIKEWVKGNKAWELNEHNIQKFKGITRQDNHSYAQFYKGAFAYADMINNSAMPFVSGMRYIKPFQLDAPIIAGKPFFDFAKHYFEILSDIQNNDKYEGYFVNDNDIVKTLDLRYKNGVGNRITRLLFDTALLLYVDRFCPAKPTTADLELFEQFLIFAFIWAYSLRAQYYNVGWLSAQNYIIGSDRFVYNSFNIYKLITEADSPIMLLSLLSGSDKLRALPNDAIVAKKDNIDEEDEDRIYQNYLHWFKVHKFLECDNEN